MNLYEIVFTTINACIALFSLGCAIYSAKQTRTQTDLMKRQVEISQEPNFPLTMRLDSIAKSIDYVRFAIIDKNTQHTKER